MEDIIAFVVYLFVVVCGVGGIWLWYEEFLDRLKGRYRNKK
jgi:hypothetical protein